MMRCLIAIDDSTLAAKFFEQVLPLEYASLEGEALAALAELATWRSIEQPLKALIRKHDPDDFHASLRGIVCA